MSSDVVAPHPAPQGGGVLVLDRHIRRATLHRPRAFWSRLDIWPALLLVSVLLSLAAPALWYEAQVAWIHAGDEAAAAAAADNSASAAEILPFDTTGGADADAEDEFGTEPVVLPDDAASDAGNNASSTNSTRLPTATELAIAALSVPANSSFWAMYLLPVCAIAYGVLWLALYWNVRLQVAMRFLSVPSARMADLDDSSSRRSASATHVCVHPVEHGGKAEICALERPTAAGEAPFFFFQKVKYIFARSSVPAPEGHVGQWFAPLRFPIAESLQSYIDRANASAQRSESDIAALQSQYGSNLFDIPLPPFMDLFREHALAPFFVFQVFCVLLWCLDEYWYYSLVTLAMLVMFEATLVKRRLKSIEFLRDMRAKPYTLQVYRGGKWSPRLSSELLPHDLVSLLRPAVDHQLVPADLLLLQGNVVVNEAMLTGESVPQGKEAIESGADSLNVQLDVEKEHKRSVLFGGTKVLLATPTAAADVTSNLRVKPPPDGGCVCYVLRTGFNTAQGKLVRTILYSSESVSVNNTESLLFLGVLLIFAIIASAYVCIKGWEDESRSRYKLMLNCIMIITSVVPPELPMELSLAVNNSLLALMKNNIFCTEPFRIPLAGAVDVTIFDKTGTLTEDNFIVKGVAGLREGSSSSSSSSSSSTDEDPDLITNAANLALAAKLVIAGCHSLSFLPESAKDSSSSSSDGKDGKKERDNLVGDPLEKAALHWAEWSVGRADSAASKTSRDRLRILHKFAFSSSLKRMSVVAAVESEPGSNLRVLAKGAAEVLHPMFDPSTLPGDYTRVHQRYAQQGCRVLALGWKNLHLRDLPDDRRALRSLHRDDAESGLTFAGFLVLTCPLKKDSLGVIGELRASGHAIMVASGDHVLTSCFVAAQLGITRRSVITLQKANDSTDSASGVEWRENVAEGGVTLPMPLDFSEASMRALADEWDLAVSGDALAELTARVAEDVKSRGLAPSAASDRMATFAVRCRVFARCSPEQKELLVHWLKRRGLTTLGAGDGGNDVGLLKQSDVGVALLSDDAARLLKESQEKAAEKRRAAIAGGPAAVKQYMQNTMQAKQSQLEKLKAVHAATGAQQNTPAERRAALQRQLAEQMSKLESELAEEENTLPRLGDASIAAPFTSKIPSIASCLDILRQGRCTLVTTMQMFNILGINCLISAYSMSALYLQGVKWGDTQMTIASLSVAGFFFCISRSQPLKHLSLERPHKRLFTPYMLLSVLGQFALHMCVLLTAIAAADPHTPTDAEHRAPEKKFQPNVLNTVVYLISNTQTIATFAANYRGRPFMESLTENRALYKCLLYTMGLMLILASEMLPPLNEFLELHPLPSEEFKLLLLALLLFDVASTYFYAKLLRKIFANKPSAEQMRDAGLLTDEQQRLKKTQ